MNNWYQRPLLFIIGFAAFFCNAQDCNCIQEFAFVRNHMEKNHPGFNSDIKDPNQPAYKAFVQSLEKKIANDPNSKYCIAYLKQYMLYLKDHHISIDGNPIPAREDSLHLLEAFYRSPAFLSTERIEIDSLAFEKYLLSKPPGIEGIYKLIDDTYTVALIKKPTARRDYAAIILHSATKLWQKGQVKFEIKMLNDSTIEMYSYLRNHSVNYDQLPFRNGRLELPGWTKTFPLVYTSVTTPISTDLFSFKILDNNTAYIAVRSFSGAHATKLDSFYKAVMPEIKKRQNLIIDVRNNGGGSDLNYKALMPLIYTDPVIGDVVDYYASPDNIRAYEQMRDLYKSKPEVYGEKGYASWEYGLEKMQKAAPNTFVPMGSGKPGITRYTANKGYPLKVALLYNRYCASSCESLLFEARFSKKVTTVGENSGGYTGYGNVMQITTPCGNRLNWTTTRYRDQRQYDFTGIPPQHRVPASESDWIEYARKLLK